MYYKFYNLPILNLPSTGLTFLKHRLKFQPIVRNMNTTSTVGYYFSSQKGKEKQTATSLKVLLTITYYFDFLYQVVFTGLLLGKCFIDVRLLFAVLGGDEGLKESLV